MDGFGFAFVGLNSLSKKLLDFKLIILSGFRVHYFSLCYILFDYSTMRLFHFY